MESSNAAVSAEKPTWRRFVDYPLIAFLIAVVLWILAGVLSEALLRIIPLKKSDLAVIVRGAASAICFIAVYKLGIRYLGAERKDDLAFNGRGMKELAIGLLLGAVLFSIVVGVAAALDIYNVVRGADSRDLVYAIFAMGLLPALTEEMLFRGIAFRWLEEWGGSWFALALTSAFFGAGHYFNPNATAFSSFAIAVEAGVLLGGAYMLTRNLWFPIGLHMAWNFTQAEIFDVPVSGIDTHGLVEAKLSGPELLSGGSFGLEASLITLVIVTACGIFFVVRAARAGQLVRPIWVRRRALERHGQATLPA